MEITAELVKRLRDETGLGIMDCKQALIKAGGDIEKAKKILREEGKEFLATQTRAVKEGRVEAYIHHSGKIGVLVEVNTATDFAANSEAFREFLKNLAMQIAAARPRWIAPEDVPQEVIAQEREILRKQAEREGKPPHIVEKIVEGRLQKFFEENCLLKQPYVRDPSLRVEDVVGELAAKLGEPVVIRRFVRFQVGEA
ncbi:MAG: elongation factor Ts [Candidatus Bipolaricaulota bacterium]|nr:elongation factor Ts [Candidatus Bipolaricaulota bacterium]MCX7844780.1 elongation factor Ts [Candidatus Bipolaricaulota bacterium]MDW8152360.1 translation elongation factor Ts [Candidatus Bipolaricaulota bacterium]